VVIVLVGNKADLVAENDKQNNYGQYAERYSDQVLDTETENENVSTRSNKVRQLNQNDRMKRQSEIETIMKNLSIKNK
jgi:hypothetical protein